jgi:hypothetical protein
MEPFQIELPRFSLSSVLRKNPELSIDNDPAEYVRKQQVRAEEWRQKQQRSGNANLHSTENDSGLARLAQHLRDIGIDPTSPADLERHKNLIRASKTLHRHAKLVEACTTLLPWARILGDMEIEGWSPADAESLTALIEASKQFVEIVQPTSEPPSQRSVHDENAAVSNSEPFTDYCAILDNINAKLDTYPVNNLIKPPPHSSPFLTFRDTILLQPRPDSVSVERELPYYAVHKTLLSIQSHAFFALTSADPEQKVFDVDTDEWSLSRFVTWLYNPNDFSFKKLSAEQLISLLCIAIDIDVAALHDAVISTLVERHTASPFPVKFRSQTESVRRLHEKTGTEDGARACVAYLLALGGEVAEVCKGNGSWKLWMDLNVLRLAQKDAPSLRSWWEGWKVPAKTFFLRTWEGDPRKRGPEVDERTFHHRYSLAMTTQPGHAGESTALGSVL